VSNTEFEGGCDGDGRGCGDCIFFGQIGPTQPYGRFKNPFFLWLIQILKAVAVFVATAIAFFGHLLRNPRVARGFKNYLRLGPSAHRPTTYIIPAPHIRHLFTWCGILFLQYLRRYGYCVNARRTSNSRVFSSPASHSHATP
jgi:hypothetical protein